MKEVLMGTLPRQFEDGNYQSVVIQVTEDCNLRCKYCYMTGKNGFKRLSFDTAKLIVDYVLSLDSNENAVAWEFIGGEPSLEMELIDRIADYAKQRMYELRHKWFDNYIFSIGTNGILYDSDAFQKFMRKNSSHFTVSITIDGTKEKHDLNRVTKENTGSFDEVVRNIPLWLNQHPEASTKVTFASEDLSLLKASILYLWNLGLKNIPANVVFEDVWKDGDDILFESQLRKLADYIIETKCWNDYSVRFFDQTLGFPIGKTLKNRNFCGSGRIMAFDCEGNLYPCVRFYDICQEGDTICLGNVHEGVNQEKKALLEKTNIGIVNDNECYECSVASGCFSCAGNNYRYTVPHSVYKRTKYNCKMHKANARVNEYFWDKWIMVNDQPSPHEMARKRVYQIENWKLDGAKYLYIMLSDSAPSFCNYIPHKAESCMTSDIFYNAVHFAYENQMIPVYIGNPVPYFTTYSRNKLHVRIDRYENTLNAINSVDVILPIFDINNYTLLTEMIDACILSVEETSVAAFSTMFHYLQTYAANIRIVTPGYWTWEEQVKSDYVNQLRCIQVVTDSSNSPSGRNDCRAGITEFCVCPDGKIYPCPGYYMYDLNPIGDVATGISSDFSALVNIKKSKDCMSCSRSNCQRCSLVNTLRLGMPNIPADIQCRFNLRE